MNLILKVSCLTAQAQCLTNWGDCLFIYLFIYLFIDNMSWQVFSNKSQECAGQTSIFSQTEPAVQLMIDNNRFCSLSSVKVMLG